MVVVLTGTIPDLKGVELPMLAIGPCASFSLNSYRNDIVAFNVERSAAGISISSRGWRKRAGSCNIIGPQP